MEKFSVFGVDISHPVHYSPREPTFKRTRHMKKLAIIAFAMIVAASVAMAGALNQFKAGDISFSVMDKDGATPMQAASIQMLGSEDGALVAETTTDDLGQAMLALDEGRYAKSVTAVDITFWFGGKEIEPALPVTVKMVSATRRRMSMKMSYSSCSIRSRAEVMSSSSFLSSGVK